MHERMTKPPRDEKKLMQNLKRVVTYDRYISQNNYKEEQRGRRFISHDKSDIIDYTLNLQNLKKTEFDNLKQNSEKETSLMQTKKRVEDPGLKILAGERQERILFKTKKRKEDLWCVTFL